MSYNFKFGSEFVWFLVITVVMAAAQTLLSFDPTTITDWQVWVSSLIGAIVRAVSGGVIAWFTKPQGE